MGGCLLNEINESAYPLAAEEIAADARTAVQGQLLPWSSSSLLHRLRPKAAVWGHGRDCPLPGVEREWRDPLGARRSLSYYFAV